MIEHADDPSMDATLAGRTNEADKATSSEVHKWHVM